MQAVPTPATGGAGAAGASSAGSEGSPQITRLSVHVNTLFMDEGVGAEEGEACSQGASSSQGMPVERDAQGALEDKELSEPWAGAASPLAAALVAAQKQGQGQAASDALGQVGSATAAAGYAAAEALPAAPATEAPAGARDGSSGSSAFGEFCSAEPVCSVLT